MEKPLQWTAVIAGTILMIVLAFWAPTGLGLVVIKDHRWETITTSPIVALESQTDIYVFRRSSRAVVDYEFAEVLEDGGIQKTSSPWPGNNT